MDQNDDHVYQPGLLFIPFGLAHTEEIVRPRHQQLHEDITEDVIETEIQININTARHRIAGLSVRQLPPWPRLANSESEKA